MCVYGVHVYMCVCCVVMFMCACVVCVCVFVSVLVVYMTLGEMGGRGGGSCSIINRYPFALVFYCTIRFFPFVEKYFYYPRKGT